MRVTTRIGLLSVFAGILVFGGWMLWAVTRVRSPIDMPISMAVGNVRTREFSVNLEAVYLIEIEAETKAFPADTLFCLLGYEVTPQIRQKCIGSDSVVKTSWTLRSDGRVVDQGSTEDERGQGGGGVTEHGIARIIGTFDPEKGRRYVLDVDILQDGTRLDSGHPHLKVVAWPDDPVTSCWGPRIVIATMVLEVVGITMLAVTLFKRRAGRVQRGRAGV